MDRTGQVLNGRYEVERIIGQGGMGAVYLARQADLGQWVAVKEMLVQHIDTHIREALVQAFRAEARILNRLHHPNLPRVYDFFEDHTSHFLVMEFIEGGTLLDEALKVAAPEAQVLQWTRELCDVLDYLHHHNPPVVFKDLKPNNVMVAKDGSIRLIDFGIAKVFDATSGGLDTATALKGAVSDGFAPIEQYGQGSTDSRSDIYALGATLYCILTRQVPPAAPDRAGGSDPLVPLSQRRPDLSDRTTTAIEWMMQISREARPRTIGEVVDALGLTPSEGAPRTSVPARIRRLLREEFHHYFPAPEWFVRPAVPLAELAGFLVGLRYDGSPAPLLGIYGAPGLGKSRVIQELSGLVCDSLDVLPVVHGARLYREQPFDCLLPCVRSILRRKAGAMMSTLAGMLDGQVLYESASALPELRAVTPEGAYTKRSAAEMTRSLLTTLMAIFALVVNDRPALFVVDDAQWLDAATMRFLDHLRGSLTGQRVALIVSWHPDADEEPHREFIERWNVEGESSVMLEMAPLSVEEVGAYVAALLPPWPELVLCQADLHEVAGGNPLALEELLRLMIVRRLLRDSQGVLRLDDWRPEHLPRQVHETIRRRLEHLPLDSQALLSYASVVGREFNVDVLRELSGEPEAVLREALQRAREASFIRLAPDQPGTFEFLSEATRQVFYDRLSPVDRSRMHRTISIMEEDRSAVTGEISHSQIHQALAGGLDTSVDSLYEITHEFLSPRTLEIVLGEMPQVKHWEASTELAADREQAALQALSMLVRAVRSKGSFGGQTYVTEMALMSLTTLLFPLLEAVGPVTVTCAESVFTVNGKALPGQSAPPELRALLARHHLSGFQLRPGLTRAELEELVDLLVRQPDAIREAGGWTAVLKQHGVAHATMSEMIYVGVSETELFDPARLKDMTTVTVRDARGVSRVPDAVDGEAPSLDRIGEMLTALQAGKTDEGAVLARLESLNQMLEDLRKASTPTVVTVEVPVASQSKVPAEVLQLAELLLEKADPQETARLLSLARAVEVPLADIMRRTPEVLLHDLEHGEPNHQVAAVTALIALGRQAVPALVGYLSRSDHVKARGAALLRKVANDLDVLLTRRVVESPSAEEACRVLSAMEQAGYRWSPSLTVLLHSPSPEVRRAAYSFFQKSPQSVADKSTILSDIIKSDHPLVVADALRASGVLRLQGLIPLLTTAARRTFDKPGETTAVQREACHALGRIGQASVLPLLRSIVFPSLTEKVAGKTDPGVRSAALWAIGRLPGDEAAEVLERCLTDRDPLLRAVAKVAVETCNATTIDPDVLAQMEQ